MENAVEKNNTKYKIELMENSSDNIKNLIYSIRGKQVMLDSDVAMLYQYTTKRINETVRRNINRFPEKFCFQLTENEIDNLRSQIATASKVFENKFRNKKFSPYAYLFRYLLFQLFGLLPPLFSSLSRLFDSLLQLFAFLPRLFDSLL